MIDTRMVLRTAEMEAIAADVAMWQAIELTAHRYEHGDVVELRDGSRTGGIVLDVANDGWGCSQVVGVEWALGDVIDYLAGFVAPVDQGVAV